MDLSTFRTLLTEKGAAALAAAAQLWPTEAEFLSWFERLSKDHPRELARAALETVLLRGGASGKFSRSDRMFFTREALEQASGEDISSYRARRFAGFAQVGDFCCGVGGDSIGLSERAEVVAVDRDSLRLAMAEQNLAAYGRRQRVTFIEGDLLRMPLPDVQAIFLDPGRRRGGRRRLAVDLYEPPLSVVRSWSERVAAMGIKIAPGVDLDEVADFDGEAEFVSVGGELKECVLWLGSLRSARRRATVLPGGETLAVEGGVPLAAVGEVRRFLYEPDPAVIRAGLVTTLAQRLSARQIDESIAYLTADEATPTPFAQVYRIEEWLPFELKRLRECLRGLHVGRLIVKRRGSAVDPHDLVRRLKLSGAAERTLFLTRRRGEPVALIGVR